MPDKLKSCPFCRSRRVTVEHYSTGKMHEHFYVNCTDCGADGPDGASHGEAVIRWNTRPPRGDGE